MTGAVKTAPKPNDSAGYIEQTTAELRDLAARSGMPFLAYLLDMARLEAASEVGRRVQPGRLSDGEVA